MLGRCWMLFVLKWTMLCRSFSNRSLLSLSLLLLLFLGGAAFSIFIAVILYSLGRYAGQTQSAIVLLLLFNGTTGLYCFCYLWGVLIELQRSDMVDFRKMLFLPVSLPAVYLMNFFASLPGPLLLFSLPGILALFWGLYPYYGARLFLVGFPLACLFYLMLEAWAYHLRGRLAMLMENPRHRRLIFMLLPVGFIFLGQLPAALIHLASRGGAATNIEALTPTILLASRLIPVFWPAYGLWAFLVQNEWLPVTLCLSGLFAATLFGLYLGYLTTLRHYMGGNNVVRRPGNDKQKTARPPRLPLRKLPFFYEDTTALAGAFYKSFSRHPHIRMLLIMPLCFGLFVLFMHRSGAYGDMWAHDQRWLPTAGLAWPYFNFSFFMFNVFGVDAVSFQSLLLLPAPRYKYLLAKNMALSPIVLGLVFFFIAVSILLTHAPWKTIVFALLLSIQLFLLFSTVGNVLSIRFPHRLHRDALRMPASKVRMMITGFLSSILSLILMLPAVLCMLLDRYASRVLDPPYANLLPAFATVTLTVLTIIAYWRMLYWSGDYFASRETRIYEQLSGMAE